MEKVKIILPKRNRLINKIFNTIEFHDRDNDASVLKNKSVLDDILERLNINKDLNETEIIAKPKLNKSKREIKQDGQFIRIVHQHNAKETIHYVCFSFEFAKGTRNGYFVSKMPVSYREYSNDESKNKTYNIFLLNIKDSNGVKPRDNKLYTGNIIDFEGEQAAVNNYQTFAYKLCKTVGINILNFDKLDWTVNRGNEVKAQNPFKSIKELKRMRNDNSTNNNKSSYIVENEDNTILYGKTFGNNGFELILMAAAAKKITEGKVYLWQIKDTNRLIGEDREAKPITAENLELLKGLDIVCFDELKDYVPNDEVLKEGDARNQAEFIKNLMLKYGTDEKKCYLCDCTIQKLIIASHIHRVCDINKENVPFEEKRAKAVSKDNGLWLCANHDKLFEHGIIYFDEDGQIQESSNELSDTQKEFIDGITINKCIDNKYLTKEMKSYLSLHRLRTHPEIKHQ